MKYEIVEGEKNDIVSLYIIDGNIPDTEPETPSIGPLTDSAQSDINPGCIAMRQFNAGQKVIVDGIRVATSWADAVTAALGGDTFTMADCAAVVHLPLVSSATKIIYGKDYLADLPVRDYLARMAERPHVQRVNADRKTNTAEMLARPPKR